MLLAKHGLAPPGHAAKCFSTTDLRLLSGILVFIHAFVHIWCSTESERFVVCLERFVFYVSFRFQSVIRLYEQLGAGNSEQCRV